MTYKASNGKEIEVVIVRKNNKNIYFFTQIDKEKQLVFYFLIVLS